MGRLCEVCGKLIEENENKQTNHDQQEQTISQQELYVCEGCQQQLKFQWSW